MTIVNEDARPFLRWAGSKRRLVPRLREFWPHDGSRYLEAFAGSACLFFSLGPPVGLLNDMNEHLIRTYKAVRSEPKGVFARLKQMPRTKEYYLRLRKQAFDEKDEIKFAANFIYLNRNCFNGLFRTNKNGEFNVPFSSQRTPQNILKDDLITAAKALEETKLSSLDFEAFVRNNVKINDFVYLDPPYAVSNRRIFRQYGPHSFGVDDLDRLRCLLDYIDGIGASFVLSYADCKMARQKFCKWKIGRAFVTRNIAGFSVHRKKSAELFISNGSR